MRRHFAINAISARSVGGALGLIKTDLVKEAAPGVGARAEFSLNLPLTTEFHGLGLYLARPGRARHFRLICKLSRKTSNYFGGPVRRARRATYFEAS